MLIAIEGCVGAGKTTIARGLAGLRRTRLLLEDFSAVPFLTAFYADPVGCALETEFSFLLQHYHQLRTAGGEDSEIIADFALDKDLIFADFNMSDTKERSVFIELYRLLASRVPTSTLTIYLGCSDGLILERIQTRGRAFELAAPPDYYRKLNAAYETFFASFEGPLLRVSADENDFCKDPELYHPLSREIDRLLKPPSTTW